MARRNNPGLVKPLVKFHLFFSPADSDLQCFAYETAEIYLYIFVVCGKSMTL